MNTVILSCVLAGSIYPIRKMCDNVLLSGILQTGITVGTYIVIRDGGLMKMWAAKDKIWICVSSYFFVRAIVSIISFRPIYSKEKKYSTKQIIKNIGRLGIHIVSDVIATFLYGGLLVLI